MLGDVLGLIILFIFIIGVPYTFYKAYKSKF